MEIKILESVEDDPNYDVMTVGKMSKTVWGNLGADWLPATSLEFLKRLDSIILQV